MGWQTKGGGSYYTRSRREGGRVVREYVGGGDMARLVAQMDALGRRHREAEREERRRAREAEEQAGRLTRWYVRAVENVLRAELTSAGFHQHDRGQWRKKRGADQKQNAARGNDMKTTLQEVRREKATRVAAVPETEEERRAIINEAMAGDDKLEAQALACLRAFPGETLLGWADPKNPCLNMVSPSDATPTTRMIRAVIEQEYNVKLKQVAGEKPTPLERLLAERVTVLRFQVTHAERLYEIETGKGMTFEKSAHHQTRIERLHKQYLRAIESLARVRRLQLPAVTVGQVNIADKQVNITAG